MVPELRAQIDKRKAFEKELKILKSQVIPESVWEKEDEEQPVFKTTVRTGRQLRAQIALTKRYKKRECIGELREYVLEHNRIRCLLFMD